MQRERKRWGEAEWLGLITVLGWIILIGSFIVADAEQRASERTARQAQDVIESLSRLPATRRTE